MSDWATFAAGDPGLADAGRRLLERSGHGSGLLATVRGEAPPRISPVSVAVTGGRLLLFVIIDSAKDRDLLADGRYALHAHPDPDVPHEFQVRGRAAEAADPTVRAGAASDWLLRSTTPIGCSSWTSSTRCSASAPPPTTGRRCTARGGLRRVWADRACARLPR